VRLVRQAIARTSQLREYAFVATTSVGATRPTRSRLEGRVVRGQGLTYRLSIGKERTEVVRLRHVTFARKVPGAWSRGGQPNADVNPTASLLALLRGFVPTERGPLGGGGAVLRGTVRPAAGHAAGLPDPTGTIRALVSLDGRGRVVALVIRTDTTAGGNSVAVTIETRYSRFGDVPGIHRPG
jgi:hypothetical protein